jgi:hypothetical protein
MINKIEVLKNLLKIEIPLSSVKIGSNLCCLQALNGQITSGKVYRVESIEFIGDDHSSSWITIINDKGESREYFFTHFNIIERTNISRPPSCVSLQKKRENSRGSFNFDWRNGKIKNVIK